MQRERERERERGDRTERQFCGSTERQYRERGGERERGEGGERERGTYIYITTILCRSLVKPGGSAVRGSSKHPDWSQGESKVYSGAVTRILIRF